MVVRTKQILVVSVASQKSMVVITKENCLISVVSLKKYGGYRARNDGWSTDNVRSELGIDRENP